MALLVLLGNLDSEESMSVTEGVRLHIPCTLFRSSTHIMEKWVLEMRCGKSIDSRPFLGLQPNLQSDDRGLLFS